MQLSASWLSSLIEVSSPVPDLPQVRLEPVDRLQKVGAFVGISDLGRGSCCNEWGSTMVCQDGGGAFNCRRDQEDTQILGDVGSVLVRQNGVGCRLLI